MEGVIERFQRTSFLIRSVDLSTRIREWEMSARGITMSVPIPFRYFRWLSVASTYIKVPGRREDSRRYSAHAAAIAALKLQLWLTADTGAGAFESVERSGRAAVNFALK